MSFSKIFLGTLVISAWVPVLGFQSANADAKTQSPAEVAFHRAELAFSQGKDEQLVAAASEVIKNDADILNAGQWTPKALDLVNQAYIRRNNGNLNIPSGASDPFKNITVHFRTYTRADYLDSFKNWSDTFTNAIWVEGPASLNVRQLKLTRHQTQSDDLVLIDLQRGTGLITTDLDPVPFTNQTKPLALARVDMPGELDSTDPRWHETRGLYTLEITLTDGRTTKTDFLMTKSQTRMAPTLRSPMHDEVVKTLTPTYVFDDFHSEDFESFEHRALLQILSLRTTEVNSSGDNAPISNVWFNFIDSPTTTSVTMKSALENTRFYMIVMQMSEQRKFGAITISRDYSMDAGFQVNQ